MASKLLNDLRSIRTTIDKMIVAAEAKPAKPAAKPAVKKATPKTAVKKPATKTKSKK